MADLPTPFEEAVARAMAGHGISYLQAALMVRLGTTPEDAARRMEIMRELTVEHETTG